jgi:hypothetical protein
MGGWPTNSVKRSASADRESPASRASDSSAHACDGRHVPPHPALTSPARRGTEEHLQTLFGSHASQIRTTPRDFTFRYHSAAHWVHVFRN